MKTLSLALALLTVGTLTTGHAHAQPDFQIIGEFYLTGLSSDGRAGSGSASDGTFEVVRWTPADGVVRLGQSSGAIFGKVAGDPKISADGSRIASTIASLDSTVVTQGRWTKGLGWEETMPPIPPGGKLTDLSLGSAFGISGDGETVVGFYWVTGSRAHASAWTSPGGLVDLGTQPTGLDSRVDASNFDGTVLAGLSSNETYTWQPTVWEDGVMTVLHADPAGNWCSAVNRDGTIVGGSVHDTGTGRNVGALWYRTETGWEQNEIGALPGTFIGGRVSVRSIAADGSIVVGKNTYSTGNATGFVWTPELGLVRAADYIALIGATIPTGVTITSMTSLSEDGRVLGGYGLDGDPYNGGRIVSFLVERWTATSAPPATRATLVRLDAIHPNPFNPSATVPLVLGHDTDLVVEIFDVAGRRVRRLFDGRLDQGRHDLIWNGRDDHGRQTPSGVYFARARGAWGETPARRMTLVK